MEKEVYKAYIKEINEADEIYKLRAVLRDLVSHIYEMSKVVEN